MPCEAPTSARTSDRLLPSAILLWGHGPPQALTPLPPSCGAEGAVRTRPLRASARGSMQSHFTGGNPEHRECEAGPLGAQGCGRGVSRGEGRGRTCPRLPIGLGKRDSRVEGPLRPRWSELTADLTRRGGGWAPELWAGPVLRAWPRPHLAQ